MPPTPSSRPPSQPVRLEAVHAVILAGGRGSRMGGLDKGLVSLHGRTLVEHVALWAAPQVRSLSISANRNAEHYARLGLTVTADDEPDFPGPLAGLLATLRRCPQPVLAVVPCDALGWPEDLIARLHAVLDERRAPAAHMAWREDGGWYTEPLPCLVRASAAEDLAAYLRGGGRSVRGWLARVGAASLEMTAPPGVVNINTLDDLQALERRAAAPAA